MKKLTTEEFVMRAKELHGDIYDYSKTDYKSMHEYVTIICPKHGVFQQTPSNHLKGHGCSLCTKVENRRMDVSEFIRRAQKKHACKYDYSDVNFVNTKTKVKIKCPVHGVFEQTPEKHMSGQGCPKCVSNYKDTTESFIEKARKVHGDKYDYSKVNYVDEHTKVCIIDKEYGEFWQQPNAHLNGRGIAARRGERTYQTKLKKGSVNKTERRVKELLVAKFGEDDVFTEYWSERYPFYCDFYIKSLDLYIEINAYWTHGRHWFNPLSDNDIRELHRIKKLAENSSFYKSVIRTWTETDIAKKNVAIQNDLNYVVFWKTNLSDFMDWYNSFDEKHVLKLY